jgi:YbgC/YbaW family acyl-CoA thioester hydrolase
MSFNFKSTISFHDCDPAGILFYGRIYFFTHSAYETMISSFNLKEDYWNNEEYVVPIIKSEAGYRIPFKYGDEVKIKIIVSKLKSSSFELSYECYNQTDELCAEVKTVHVFVDKKLWKKKAMNMKLHENLRNLRVE